jgi:glycosyltransferase involved in cell wall biosynthesis
MEQFGMVGIEAMAKGMPVIASKRGGITEWLVGGYNGLFARPADPKSIAEQIQKLEDESVYRKIQKNCVDFVRNYPSEEKHVQKLEQVYKKTIRKYR